MALLKVIINRVYRRYLIAAVLCDLVVSLIDVIYEYMFLKDSNVEIGSPR